MVHLNSIVRRIYKTSSRSWIRIVTWNSLWSRVVTLNLLERHSKRLVSSMLYALIRRSCCLMKLLLISQKHSMVTFILAQANCLFVKHSNRLRVMSRKWMGLWRGTNSSYCWAPSILKSLAQAIKYAEEWCQAKCNIKDWFQRYWSCLAKSLLSFPGTATCLMWSDFYKRRTLFRCLECQV